MTAAFDTLAYAKRLKEAGFTESQAEVLAQAQSALVTEQLATKDDLARLEERLTHRMETQEERARGRFTLLQWIIGFNLALTVAVLWLLLRQAGAL